MGIPDACKSGVEFGEKRPGRPAENAEEGAVHGGKPGFRIAFIEDDNGVRVGRKEFFGEERARNVENALGSRWISEAW